MLCIWEEQLFPAALLSGMELTGRVLIAFLEIKAAGTGVFCRALLPPGAAHQRLCLPVCAGKCLTWRDALPRPLRASAPYPAAQASGPAKADAAVPSSLNANAGHKS